MTGLLSPVALFLPGTTHDYAIWQAGPSILSSQGTTGQRGSRRCSWRATIRLMFQCAFARNASKAPTTAVGISAASTVPGSESPAAMEKHEAVNAAVITKKGTQKKKIHNPPPGTGQN